jgi:hypothetical protein
MNSQELRALQEAYSQVYELDEAKVDKDKTMVQKIKSRNERSGIDSTPQRRLRTQAMRGIGKGGGFQSRSNPQRINDSYDLYDIILSHLLDEGYADTEQAAEAIMVNMSEDWRESIVEGAAGAFVPSKVDDSNNRRDMLKNRYGQDVSPRIPGPSGGGQFEKPSSNPAGALRLAKTSSKSDTKTA